MGTKEKARKFLEVSETHAFYSTIIDYVLAYFIARAEKEGNPSFVDDLKRAKQGYTEDFEKAIEVTEEVYCEMFSDEELNDMTVMHTTPAIKRLRGLTPEIMNKVLEKYALRSG
jgi:hypothetical protein